MTNRAERVVEKAEAALDAMVRKNPMIDATGILEALSHAGLALVEKPTTGTFPKCPACNGLGFGLTVEQFENAYKRH